MIYDPVDVRISVRTSATSDRRGERPANELAYSRRSDSGERCEAKKAMKGGCFEAALMAATSATGGATSPGLSANLGFISNKKQFKWNGSQPSLKEFWISELADGIANSLVNINSNANSEVLKFEFATINFYTSTKTLQIQGASKDCYVEKLLHIVEKLNRTIEEDRNAENVLSTPNALKSETETATMAGPNSAHDDRYEEFKSFMKMQLEFYKKLESLMTTNSIGINEQVIELKDLEHKCKNQTREVNLACDSSIHAMKIELGDEIQKLVKQISNLSTKLVAEVKALKTRAKSTEDSVNHIVQQLSEIKKPSLSFWGIIDFSYAWRKSPRFSITNRI